MSLASRWRYLRAAGFLLAGFTLGPRDHLWTETQRSKGGDYPLGGWSPTQGTAPRSEYVGPNVCAQCHTLLAASQKKNLMAHAAVLPADSNILRAHPQLKFRQGPYAYEFRRGNDSFVYAVSEGTRAISETVLSAFGFGALGQTYIFQHDGSYYESRVSYFTAIKGLDITIGHSREMPESLEEALGSRLSLKDATRCFSCHTTAAVSDHRLDPSRLIPGVTCEACHGAGARHVAAMKSGKPGSRFIFNPGQLEAGDLVDFCGACHRTALQVMSLGRHGPQTVRFQPYRLVSSRCWDPSDARISCLSCHDPHQALVRNTIAYDSKCLACHLLKEEAKRRGDHPEKTCPVSERNCVTCHMPKVELPGGHARFADHYIRVVRPGEGYPD